MQRASELGRNVKLMYCRPSRFLLREGREPDQAEIAKMGICLERVEALHAKFLAWDSDALAITSFNWLATAVDGTRAKSAELGVLALGPKLFVTLAQKLSAASSGKIIAGADCGNN
jgi:hypothetical protein